MGKLFTTLVLTFVVRLASASSSHLDASPSSVFEAHEFTSLVTSQENMSERADMLPMESSSIASATSLPKEGDAGHQSANSCEPNARDGEQQEASHQEGSRPVADVASNSLVQIRRRRKRSRRNRLAAERGLKKQSAANGGRRGITSTFEGGGHYYQQACPLLYIHPFAAPYETAYQISPSYGYSTWLLTTYTQFCRRGFEGQSKHMAQILRKSGWSGCCYWTCGADQWYLLGVEDNFGPCFVPPPPLSLELRGTITEGVEVGGTCNPHRMEEVAQGNRCETTCYIRFDAQKMTNQISPASGSTACYKTSYTEFRKHALRGMRSYMLEQLAMRGWSGHCFWREGAHQWELIGISDNSERCFVPPPPPPLRPKCYVRKECETREVVEVHKLAQSTAATSHYVGGDEQLVQQDNGTAAIPQAEKEHEKGAANLIRQVAEAEGESQPAASSSRELVASNVTTSHDSEHTEPAGSEKVLDVATSVEHPVAELPGAVTNGPISDGAEFTSLEASSQSSLELKYFGAVGENEDLECVGMDGLDGFHLPPEMVRADYHMPCCGSQMGLALVRVAGEQIRCELGAIRSRLACQEPQKQELIGKLCGPKEQLLKAAKAALNLACRNGKVAAIQDGSERCETRPPEEEAASSSLAAANKGIPDESENMYPRLLSIRAVRGEADRSQPPRPLQLQPGTLLWLLSCEGSQQCRRLMHRHSSTWNLIPQEVFYSNTRFYEFVADYHFAVTMQKFLYGSWPLQPLKSMPGGTALASPYVLRILSGTTRCPHGEAAKRDLETFQREHIELMQNHLRERRTLLSNLLNPPPPHVWPSNRPNFNPSRGRFFASVSNQPFATERRTNRPQQRR